MALKQFGRRIGGASVGKPSEVARYAKEKISLPLKSHGANVGISVSKLDCTPSAFKVPSKSSVWTAF